MKKVLSIVALAAIVLGFYSCKPKPEPEPEDNSIKINISSPNVRFYDETANPKYAYWEILGADTAYLVCLSNAGKIDHVAGEYAVSALDPEYSYIKTQTDSIWFLQGSITLTVEDGGKKVTAKGEILGSDSLTYKLNIVYTEPTAQKTKNVNIPDAVLIDSYAEVGVYVVGGKSADEITVLLSFIDFDDFGGEYTEEDLDPGYLMGSGILDGEEEVEIFAAELEVTPAAGGSYGVSGTILGYNNTQYNLSMTATPKAGASKPAKVAKASAKSIKFAEPRKKISK